MNQIGTESRPLRVAVIGSGPSGFYAAEGLFKQKEWVIDVDMFERLPTPFGLLRGGVAPDHQKMKSVAKAYERTAAHPHFSFYGNVTIGKDLSVEELKEYYDAIVFAYGAESDRALGIPGESLKGSHTATEFVGWYNGHPDYQSHEFDLSAKSVAIIGQGNVAIDVTRILAKSVEELASSDITSHALKCLSESQIENIYMIGRRGPVQAAFTELEIKEMGVLNEAEPVVDPSQLDLSPQDQAELDDPKNNKARKNMAVLDSFVQSGNQGKQKKVHIRFLQSPVEIKGKDKVEELVLETNELVGEAGAQKAIGTGRYESIKVDLVFRSIGYNGNPMPGVPFNQKKGAFDHEKGRILDGETPIAGLYTAGWIKRGPSGVIGTNRADSFETIASLIEDLPTFTGAQTPDSQKMRDLLDERGVRVISFEDWKKIDAHEVTQGEKVGKPREKIRSVQDALAILES